MKTKVNNYMGRNFSKTRENDRISKENRSNLMSKIRSKSTEFEKRFIDEMIKIIDFEFDLNVKEIKGKPDIVFHESKICVFLDSDFWHGWQFPRWKHLLKSDFWVTKITKNRERDIKIRRFLKNNGWIVIRIWEHNIKKDINHEINKIERCLLNFYNSS